MLLCKSGKLGKHRCLITLENSHSGFNFYVDRNTKLLLYPDDEGKLQGPGGKADDDDAAMWEGNSWVIEGVPYVTYEVILDVSQADRRRMVTWHRMEAPGFSTSP